MKHAEQGWETDKTGVDFSVQFPAGRNQPTTTTELSEMTVRFTKAE